MGIRPSPFALQDRIQNLPPSLCKFLPALRHIVLNFHEKFEGDKTSSTVHSPASSEGACTIRKENVQERKRNSTLLNHTPSVRANRIRRTWMEILRDGEKKEKRESFASRFLRYNFLRQLALFLFEKLRPLRTA